MDYRGIPPLCVRFTKICKLNYFLTNPPGIFSLLILSHCPSFVNTGKALLSPNFLLTKATSLFAKYTHLHQPASVGRKIGFLLFILLLRHTFYIELNQLHLLFIDIRSSTASIVKSNLLNLLHFHSTRSKYAPEE